MHSSEEIDEKYQQVKSAISGGMPVYKALKEFQLDHGSYYGRRAKDPDKIVKGEGLPRGPKLRRSRSPKSQASFIIPLESDTAPVASAPAVGKVVMVVCEVTQIKTVLEGLSE